MYLSNGGKGLKSCPDKRGGTVRWFASPFEIVTETQKIFAVTGASFTPNPLMSPHDEMPSGGGANDDFDPLTDEWRE